eukprot:scaffold173917_cov21-Tisochrysis_lutea.AAC.1
MNPLLQDIKRETGRIATDHDASKCLHADILEWRIAPRATHASQAHPLLSSTFQRDYFSSAHRRKDAVQCWWLLLSL